MQVEKIREENLADYILPPIDHMLSILSNEQLREWNAKIVQLLRIRSDLPLSQTIVHRKPAIHVTPGMHDKMVEMKFSGKLNSEIAKELNVSDPTVGQHLKNNCNCKAAIRLAKEGKL